MDSFNKIISFILGLVVVVVFFAVVTKKLDLGKGLLNFNKTSGKTTVSLSPTPTPKSISTIKINTNNNTYNTKTSNTTTIPSAGLPTLFIPALISGLIGGNFLRKAGKK
jgi:hypothetical protein